MLRRRPSLILAAVACAVLAGCSAQPGGSTTDTPPTSERATDADPGHAPTSAADSDTVIDRIVVLSNQQDPASERIAGWVNTWATQRGVDASVDRALDDDDVEQRVLAAAATSPDVIIGAGPGIVDVFALLTSQFLDQQFLVIGAQLAEPTENVTAVIWPGAGFRGTGISEDGSNELDALTEERVLTGMDIGIPRVAAGDTGKVFDLSGAVVPDA